MKRRLIFLIAATYAIFVVGYGVRGKAQQPTAPASPCTRGVAAGRATVRCRSGLAGGGLAGGGQEVLLYMPQRQAEVGRPRVNRSGHLRAGEEHRVMGEGYSQAGDRRHAARENAASGQGDGGQLWCDTWKRSSTAPRWPILIQDVPVFSV